MWSRWLGYDLTRATSRRFRARRSAVTSTSRASSRAASARSSSAWSRSRSASARARRASIDEQIDALDGRRRSAQPGTMRLARTGSDVAAAAVAARWARSSASRARTRSRAISTSSTTSRAAASATSASPTSAPTRPAIPPTAGDGATREGLTPFGRDARPPLRGAGRHRRSRAYQPRRASSRPARWPPSRRSSATPASLGAFEHWRNIDDEQLRAVADSGGVHRRHLLSANTSAATGSSPSCGTSGTSSTSAARTRPALGSDWDGFIVPTQRAPRRGAPAAAHRRAPRGRA